MSNYKQDVKKINSDFSLVSKIANYWIRNQDWTQGWNYINQSDINDTSLSALAQTSNYASLWKFLSAAIDESEVSNKFYEKLSNFISNTEDIDTCELHSLQSIARNFGASNFNFFELDFPQEVYDYINIFSISKNKLFSGIYSLSGLTDLDNSFISRLTNNSITTLIQDISTTVINDSMSGYTNINSTWDSNIFNLIEALSANPMIIDDVKYRNVISATFSELITSKLENGTTITYDDQWTYQADEEEIKILKLNNNISKNVNIKHIANNIILKKDNISNYNNLLQIVITAELNRRKRQQNINDSTSKYYFDNKQEKLNYIQFIQNLVNSKNRFLKLYYIDNNFVTIDDSKPYSILNYDISTSSSSGEIIEQASVILQNLCINISYIRNSLKYLSQKHSIRGASKLIQAVISEYLGRYFTNQKYWRMEQLSDYSNDFGVDPVLTVDQIPFSTDPELSGILGDIRVTEYFDNTEYLNIIPSIYSELSADGNLRYWQGDALSTAMLLSEHTDVEVVDFYKQLGLTDMTSGEIYTFINAIYDYGAVTADLYSPEIITSAYTVEISGPSTVITSSGPVDYWLIYNYSNPNIKTNLSDYIICNTTDTARVSTIETSYVDVSTRLVRLSDIYGNGTINVELSSGSTNITVLSSGLNSITYLYGDSSSSDNMFLAVNREVPEIIISEPEIYCNGAVSGTAVYYINFLNADTIASDFNEVTITDTAAYTNYLTAVIQPSTTDVIISDLRITGNGNLQRKVEVDLYVYFSNISTTTNNISAFTEVTTTLLEHDPSEINVSYIHGWWNRPVRTNTVPIATVTNTIVTPATQDIINTTAAGGFLNFTLSGHYANNYVGYNESSCLTSQYFALYDVNPKVIIEKSETKFTSGDDIVFEVTYIGVDPYTMNKNLSTELYSFDSLILLSNTTVMVSSTGNVNYTVEVEKHDSVEEKRNIRITNIFGQGTIKCQVDKDSAFGTVFKMAEISNISDIITVDTIGVTTTTVTEYTDTSSVSSDLVMMEIHKKYSGNTYNPLVYANIKNKNYPTFAPLTFLWNLSKKEIDYLSIKSLDNFVIFNDQAIVNSFSSDYPLISVSGCTVNSWINYFDEFIGYETAFEYSPNLDYQNRFSDLVDRDGPWIPNALSTYLINPTNFIQGMSKQIYTDKYNFYKNVELNEVDVEKIEQQLIHQFDSIAACANKVIYNYGVDMFGNHWTLFKDSDDYDIPGELWLRYKNHPLSFKLMDGNGYSIDNKHSFDFISTSGGCSQIDVEKIKVNFMTDKCYDFGLVDDKVWLICANEPSGADYSISEESCLTGQVNLMKLTYKVIPEENNRIKLTGLRCKNNILRLNIDPTEQIVGIFDNNGSITLATVDLIGNKTVYPESGTLKTKINFKKYSDTTINAFDSSTKTIEVKYLANDSATHNCWKVAHGNDYVTLAYEFVSSDLLNSSDRLYSNRFIDASTGYSVFDINSTFCSDKQYENGIAVIDYNIYNEKIRNTSEPKYYFKYSDLTFHGINGDNSDQQINYNKVSVNNWINFQFFGSNNTFTSISIDYLNPLKVGLDASGSLYVGELSTDLGYAWYQYNESWDTYNTIMWNDAHEKPVAWTFTNPGDTIRFDLFDSLGQMAYVFMQYLGDGCKKFRIKYNYDYVSIPSYVWDHVSGDLSYGLTGFTQISGINSDLRQLDIADYTIYEGLEDFTY